MMQGEVNLGIQGWEVSTDTKGGKSTEIKGCKVK